MNVTSSALDMAASEFPLNTVIKEGVDGEALLKTTFGINVSPLAELCGQQFSEILS